MIYDIPEKIIDPTLYNSRLWFQVLASASLYLHCLDSTSTLLCNKQRRRDSPEVNQAEKPCL